MDDQLYMTAEEAAAALEVNVATIYAYVSRKQLRSHRLPGVRAAKYWRADVERMRRKIPAAAQPSPTTLVASTQITVMTDVGPYYRGHSAVELSRTATLEEVASLLWRADQATVFPAAAPAPLAAGAGIWSSLDGLGAVDKALALFPLIEREAPRAHDLSPAGFARTAGEAMRWFAAITVDADRPESAPLHETIARRAADVEAMSEIARVLLVLSADHELDPTTYAVRAVANAGINPYRVLLAGLITTTGRRIAYGRYQEVQRLLDEIYSSDAPQDVIVGRLKEGDAVPGFGSPQYPGADPRAVTLLAAIERCLPSDPDVAKLKAAIATVREVVRLEPAFGMVNLFVGRKLGLTRQGGIALRLGRMAGWIAHAMEQYHERDLVRPTAPYVGPLPEAQA